MKGCLGAIAIVGIVGVLLFFMGSDDRTTHNTRYTIEKPIRINKDSVRGDKNNIVSTYKYKPLYSTVGVSGDDYEKKLSDNPYWPYYDGNDLRMRINDSSTVESIVYKAAKNVQLYINDKTALRNWGSVFDKYEPLLGEYRFYAIMVIGYKDGMDGRK